MVARNEARSLTRRLAAREDGTSEASLLQAFLIQLERQGLVQSAQSHGRNGGGSPDGAANPSSSADVASAVRKLIAALREPS